MIRDLKIPQPKAWNHNQIWFELTGTSWEVMRKWDFVFRQIELKYFEVLMMLFYEFLKRQFLLQLENHLKHRMKSKLRFDKRSITWNLKLSIIVFDRWLRRLRPLSRESSKRSLLCLLPRFRFNKWWASHLWPFWRRICKR